MNSLSKRVAIFIAIFILLLSGSYLSVDAREIDEIPQSVQLDDGWETVNRQLQIMQPNKNQLSALITVNTNLDGPIGGVFGPTDGACSLREAIWNANAGGPASPDCPAGFPGFPDTIVFAPALGPIFLTHSGPGEDIGATGDLDVLDMVTISGAPGGQVIDGTFADRVFHVNTGGGVDFNNLIIQNGAEPGNGGGILNQASQLTIRNSQIINNNSGGGGGGIATMNTPLTVLTSTISTNFAQVVGGGIFFQDATAGATATIIGSTIDNNNVDPAGDSGGGIGNGSGIFGVDGYNNINVWNSTISNNSAPAGGGASNISIVNPVAISFEYATVAENPTTGFGGGLINISLGGAPTTINLASTIVAYHPTGDCRNSGGPGEMFSSWGGSVDTDNSCFLFPGPDLPLTDPQLMPLANNGGSTMTRALAGSSPAIDFANGPNCGNTGVGPFDLDQRGFARPNGASCDSGAYETAPVLVDACWTEINGDNTTDFMSSDAQAVQDGVNAVAPGGTVKVSGYCAGVNNLGGTMQTVMIAKNLTLQGGYTNTMWLSPSDPDTYTTTLDATNAGTVVMIPAPGGVNVDLDGLTIINGNSALFGGAGGTGFGGGIFADSSSLQVSNSVIMNNVATGAGGSSSGGGIAVIDTTLTVITTTIYSNTAAVNGGGIFLHDSSGLMNGSIIASTISNNSASDAGGGVSNGASLSTSNGYGNLTILNSTISGNTSASRGGGINNYSPNFNTNVDLRYTTVTSNTAPACCSGGGIYNYSGGGAGTAMTTLLNSIIANQFTTGRDCGVGIGGGIFSLGGSLDSDGSCFLTAGPDMPNTNPQLIPLADNGGRTWTHALASSSPAIDFIAPGGSCGSFPFDVDQRGSSRPSGVNCDIGAYETFSLNTAPTAVDDMYGGVTDTMLTVSAPGVLTNDTDPETDPLTAIIDTAPITGTFIFNPDGSFTYDPPIGWSGVVTFTYHANDGSLNSNIATVTITVGAANCWTENTGDNTTDYVSSDASAVQMAVDSMTPGVPIKVAGYCAGVKTNNGFSNTVYIVQSLTMQGGYTDTAWLVPSDPNTYQTVLDGVNSGSVIYINPPTAGETINIDGLMVTNGNQTMGFNPGSGGIWVESSASLNVSNSKIVTNSTMGAGGGISMLNGTGVENMTILTSTIDNNTANSGGGVALNGTHFLIQNTTISNNQAWFADGGGIMVGQLGPMAVNGLIETSLIAGNNAVGNGGGIANGNQGWSAADGVASLTIRNSTVTGNNATGPDGGGGIVLYNNGGFLIPQMNLQYSTIANNSAIVGGGISSRDWTGTGTQTNMEGTIIAYHGASGGDCTPITANDIFNSQGNNIDTDNSCFLSPANDLPVTNPMLAPLADNGGDTWTHALMIGSPAIDPVLPPSGLCGGVVVTDQRGVNRPVGANCDIGAYEFFFANTAPVAVDDTYTTTEDIMLTVPISGVLMNDSDPDSDPITAMLNMGPITGTFIFSNDGSFTYDPPLNWSGWVTFTYWATDTQDISNMAIVTITVVSGGNNPPVTMADDYTTTEDTVLVETAPGLLGNDSDPDADPLTASVGTPPISGTLVVYPDGGFEYTPTLDFNGVMIFTYQVSDGMITVTQMVTLTFLPVNDPPILVVNEPLTVTQGLSGGISNLELLVTDVDNPPNEITFTLETTPTNGQLLLLGVPLGPDDIFLQSDIDSGNLVYQHNGNGAITDTFDFNADDHLVMGGMTTRVSVNSSEGEGLDNSGLDPSFASADGRYILFGSDAINMIASDTNGVGDVFIRDTVAGTTVRVSVDSLGNEANGASYPTALSADGRYVTFSSAATNLVPGDTNNVDDVFVHDTVTGSTIRVSVDSLGNEGNSFSSAGNISDDGRYVVFNSGANNLVVGDTNGQPDIFVHDITTGSTIRVSVDSLGNESNAGSQGGGITGDGRYIVFGSQATNLVVGDTNGQGDIFVHDINTASTIRVSVDSVGNEANGFSFQSNIAANGRYVAFGSMATNLVAGDTNGQIDTFVHDMMTGVTTRVSVDSLGNEGDGFSAPGNYLAALSADGRYVVFASAATNLVAGDTNGFQDIFVHDRMSGETVRVSVDSAGNESDNMSFYGTLSGDGRYAIFSSTAGNLVADDTNNLWDVFVNDRVPGSAVIQDTFWINIVPAGPNQPPIAVADAYTTTEDMVLVELAPGLLGNDSDPNFDPLTAAVGTAPISGTLVVYPDGGFEYTPTLDFTGVMTFTYQVSDGMITVTQMVTLTFLPVNDPPILVVNEPLTVTQGLSGGISNLELLATDVDNPPNEITFTLETTPTNGQLLLLGVPLGPDDTFLQSDIDSGNLVYQHNGNGAITDTFDFNADDHFVMGGSGMTTRASLDSSEIEGNAGSGFDPSYASADGRYILFGSDATNLIVGDTNGVGDVFIRDTVAGTTVRVSVDSLGNEANGASYPTALSADGRYVTFSSAATNLVPGDTNNVDDVFVHDTVTGSTIRVSVDSLGNESNSWSFAGNISDDGRYVVFGSQGTNLIPGDTNGLPDIFVHDITTGSTIRVSVDSVGNEANGGSQGGSVTADGRYVAFYSQATNLVVGDTNGVGDVFVHDITTGSTIRVSVDSVGNEGDSDSFQSNIAANGRYISFGSMATNLVAGDTNGAGDVFVHDMMTGVTTRVSVDSLGNEGNGFSSAGNYLGGLSADGRYVLFNSWASNLVVGDTNGFQDIFVHDRMSGETVRVSVDSAGNESNNMSFYGAISGDGRYAIFSSQATNLVAADTNGDWDVFIHELGSSGGPPAIQGTFWINIVPAGPNSPPVVVADYYTPTEDIPLVVPGPGLLGNDFDPDGDTLTATVGIPPISGTLVIYPDGGFVYTPTMDFDGVITFTYQVWDGTITVTQMVTLTFIPVNDAPIIGPDLYTATAGITLTVPGPGVLGNDYDVEGNPMSVLTYTMPITGVLVVNPDGGFEYYPPVTYSGTVTFTYTCDDGEGGTTIGIVTFTVSACTVPTISVGPVTITHNVTQTDVILDWLGTGDANHYEIWYSTDTPDLDTNPYFTISGSCAAPGPGMFCDTSNTTDWAHVNGYGDPAINYFYKILGANSCGGGPWNPIEHKGEFDFTIVPGS